MINKKFLFVLLFIFLILKFTFAGSIYLSDISVEENKVKIKISEDIKYSAITYKKTLILITLFDTKFKYEVNEQGKEIRSINVNSDYIIKIRTAQYTQTDARIVIEMADEFNYEVKKNNDLLIIEILEKNKEDENKSEEQIKENKTEIAPSTNTPEPKIEQPKKNISSEISEKLQQKIKLLDFKDVDIKDVLKLIAKEGDLNLIISEKLIGKITIRLSNITIEKALKTILETVGYSYSIEDNILNIIKLETAKKEYETKIYKIEYANINHIYQILNNTFKDEIVNIEKDNRTNSIIITAEKNKFAEIQKIIQEIDKMPEYKGSEVKTVVFTLSYAKAAEIKNIINQIITTQQFGEMQVQDFQQKQKFTYSTETSELPIFRGKTNVVVDERTNSLIISTNYPENITAIKEIITKLDKPIPQVLIEARFYEVNLTKEEKFGIDWSNFGNISVQTKDNVISYSLQNWKPTYGVLDVKQMSVFLKALNSRANVKILSNPRITTLDNKTAIITIAENVVTDQKVTESEGGNFVSTTTIRNDIGITLEVTPHINVNNYITMELKPSVNEPRKSVYQQNQLDILKREATTTVVVKDGSTIVLGGLIKNKVDKANSGLPILSKIPILKSIFGSKEYEEIRTELLILVTPYIINEESKIVKEAIERFE
ncbi:MAG TPA: secretin N-terminal domain-containing protein [bacterium]|nr:secretin N-terminal domain-containing protein [bacterium]HPQ19562.1 secretin N-terminal domain-containing protein [bacterium]